MLDATEPDRQPLLPALDVEIESLVSRIVAAAAPESIHELRIAIRRLLTLLRALRQDIDAASYDNIRSALRGLLAATGPARDAYVRKRTGMSLLESTRSIPAQDAKHYSSALDAELDVAAIALSWYLHDKGCFACLARTHDALDRLRTADVDGHEVRTLRARFDRLLGRIERRLGRNLERARKVHALRIRIKDARYLGEMPPSPSRRTQSAIRQLGKMQGALGDLHDMEQLRVWLLKATLSSAARKKLQSSARTAELELRDQCERRRKPLQRAITRYLAGT